MKKYITLLVVAICVMLLVVGCSKKDGENGETDTSYDFSMNNWNEEFPSDFSGDFPMDGQEIPSDPNNPNNPVNPNNPNTPNIPNIPNTPNTTTPQNTPGGNGGSNGGSGGSSIIPSNPFISDEDLSKLENSNAVTYFSDNPNNKYIVKVVNKYGADAKNLVALIKVNAQFPEHYVLEFSGQTDASGELLMTYNELKYVYIINETKNTLVRAGKNGVGNDGGISSLNARIYFAMMKEYIIPNIPNLKANSRYPE